MSTIGKTKAAEMAYRKIQMLKAQMLQRDFNPSDDYKGSLMGRSETRRETRMDDMDKQDQEMMRIAKIANNIESGFKRK
jgi:hypothetical protein|tara:strand:- start:122 stop:358 length:237 start_codon:yes stop_codon:yes gene_type:complete